MYHNPSIKPIEIPPSLAHLTLEDQQTFIKYSFGPTRPIPFPIVHHAFEYHVQQNPDAICVEHEAYGHSMTYLQIDKLANRLARRVKQQMSLSSSSSDSLQRRRRRGEPVSDGGYRICILARRSIYLIISIIAILKSGAQYVPIDAATITDEALRHIINDSDPEMVLVMEEFIDRFDQVFRITGEGEGDIPRICVEQTIEEDERLVADDTKPQDLTRSDDGCYIIYTSGTTGVPKGVDVRHIGVSNVICAPPGNVHMKPGMRVAQLLNIAFDMGAWEILSSLYNGCTLCLRGNTFKEWVHLLKTVDVVISTPSILARHDPAEYPNIKHVIVGGEVCPQSLADNWASHTQFNNCCGPTEISICNTIQPHSPGYPLSIGTPIPNTAVYILSQDYDSSSPTRPEDRYLTPPLALPIGQTGSMWVGGIGVSKGYLNLPCKTGERWLPDPFRNQNRKNENEGEDGDETVYLMFNTNDLGRWREDGQLEHCGRADDQVKVRGGFRVELDGVASAMMRASFVRAAVALLIDGVLWGFAMRFERCCRGGGAGDGLMGGAGEVGVEREVEEVTRCTKDVMSYYAVPERWVIMDEFPMTRNGKVDKRALIAMAVLKKEKELKEKEEKEIRTREETEATKEESDSISNVSTPTTSTISIPTTPTRESEEDDEAGTTTTPTSPYMFRSRQSSVQQYPSPHSYTHETTKIYTSFAHHTQSENVTTAKSFIQNVC